MASVTEAAPWTMAAEQATENLSHVVVRTFEEFSEILDRSDERRPVTVNYAELLRYARGYEAQEPRDGLAFPEIRMYFNGGDTHLPYQQVIDRIKRLTKREIAPDVEFTDKVFAVWRQSDQRAQQYMERMLSRIKRSYGPQ